MKKLLLSSILVVCIFATCEYLQAQNMQLKQANAAFERFQYPEAMDGYEKVLEKDKKNREATEKLAHCHRIVGNYAKAEYWYGKAMRMNKSEHIFKFYYAQALMSNGKYKEAEKQFEAYTKVQPKDTRGWRFLDYCQNLDQYLLDPEQYHVSSLPVNSEASDFSPVFYGRGIVFTSSRRDHLLEKKYVDGESFTDMYYVEPTTSGRWTNARKLEGKTSNAYHEGPASFNKKGNKMYFTRNVNKGKAKKSGVANLRIYESQLVNGKWSEGRELPFCSEAYSVGHPAISPDGSTLYFISDMPGGFGGKDIYVSNLRNGRWSRPANMGADINSEGDEMFPSVQSDGGLHFASDGLGGFGGLDVFEALQNNGEWTANNLGYPINSPRDDFGIVYDESKKLAYFSSNRDGTDDLYVLEILEAPQPVAEQTEEDAPAVYGAPAGFGNENNNPISMPKPGYVPESAEPLRKLYKSYTSSGLSEEPNTIDKPKNEDLGLASVETISGKNAPQQIVLNGIILNEINNKPMPNVPIIVEDIVTKERLNLTSNDKGNFYCGLNAHTTYVVRKMGPDGKPDAVKNIDTNDKTVNVFQLILKGLPTEQPVYAASKGNFTPMPASTFMTTGTPSKNNPSHFLDINERELWYRVQIGAFSKPLDEESDYLLRIGARIDRENTRNGIIRYITGSFYRYPEAEAYCESLKSKYPDAFVVAYYDDNRVEKPIQEVLRTYRVK